MSSESFNLRTCEKIDGSSVRGLAGVKRPLLDYGKGRHGSPKSRLSYLDSLILESEKRYEQTWQLIYVEDRIAHLREILAMLQTDRHQSPKVSWRVLLRSACLFTSRRM